MTNSKTLSNYDKITAIKGAKLLIIDLDGTLIDFEKIDNIIIATLFPDSRVINSIDNLLWKVNRLDVLGNGYAGLKIRLAFYSLFSKYSLQECKREYGRIYESLAREELLSIFNNSLLDIIKSGYDVSIVTKNRYAESILNKEALNICSDIADKISFVVLRKDKKKKFKEMIKKYNGNVCVIGNNLSDDIFSSYMIDSPYIYIGKSRVVSHIMKITNKIFNKKGVQFKNFEAAKNIFLKEQE